MEMPLLLGHRGLRMPRLAPENSVSAFDLALEHGCDGFEFDVRLTKCGRAVVCHKPRVGNVTVSRATRQQLCDLPQLAEVVQRYGQRVFLDIELKVEGLERLVLDALKAYPPNRDYVISSFTPDVIMEIVARRAMVPTGILCKTAAQLSRWPKLPIDYVIPYYTLINPKLVEDVHRARRKVIAWTVNTAGSMQRMANMGVDAIISDNTQLLVRTFKSSMDRAKAAGMN
jgi:glycerophosphoryl diester phosphodiesterase